MNQKDQTANVSVLIPTKNEEKQLARCLDNVKGWAKEIVVVDSGSTDNTLAIAEQYGATVLNFDYRGGWPKKRNWALKTHSWKADWILLLDADEILTEAVKSEIKQVIESGKHDGYWINFEIVFLGRQLRHGDTSLRKLSLFRAGKGMYERRLENQDQSMLDMEVHEHVVVDGSVGRLSSSIRHENIQSLSHYIQKHDAYSNWEAHTWVFGDEGSLTPRLFGNQAERRRWLRKSLMNMPGFPVIVFVYTYFLRLGILDGKPGFFYALFRMVQFFHIKAKIYELSIQPVDSQ
ncbi:MAG: glycosyltransferase family 2 protein [Alphaproteobacteria bacterium]|nr:MAG: glycosyltransferase family 2 protein [Alphaproteobacteria bacterium]